MKQNLRDLMLICFRCSYDFYVFLCWVCRADAGSDIAQCCFVALCTLFFWLVSVCFCHSLFAKVGSISANRPTATCSPEHTLLEASKLLQSAGRTAALIVDNERSVLGVLTENDMLPLAI